MTIKLSLKIVIISKNVNIQIKNEFLILNQRNSLIRTFKFIFTFN